MDPAAVVGVAYAAETAVEGAAAYAITTSTLPLKARLEHLSPATPIPRSSHTLSIVGRQLYIFGGELQPRQPVSNAVDTLSLPLSSDANLEHESIEAKAVDGGDAVPPARVGHTAATARDCIFVFGGRGGAEMTALPENGRLWVFDTKQRSWQYLDPPPNTDYPPPRSYHASTSTDDAVIVHAGCSSDGGRLVDTWAFYLDEGRWRQLADAPGPARGGTSLTYGQGKVWRFGGFDGKTELGGQLDFMEMPSKTRSETTPSALVKSEWNSIPFDFSTKEAHSNTVPPNRSLAAFQHVTMGLGRDYLLLALGEGDPSSIGHAGAGKFWQDVWCYQLPASSATPASVKDAIRETLPDTGTSKGQWAKVEITELEVGADEKLGGKWTGRGWFGSCGVGDVAKSGLIIWGGIDEENERLGDGWLIALE